MKELLLRKEHFGGIVFDKNTGNTYYCDDELFSLFLLKHKLGNNEDVIRQLKSNNVNEDEIYENMTKFSGIIDYPSKIVGRNVNLSANKLQAPILAHIAITEKCNLNCSRCYFYKGHENNNTMSLHNVKSTINTLSKQGVFQVAFGGGEPLLHPDFISILKYTMQNNIIATFTTNGLIYNEKVCQLATAFHVSLDAITPEQYQEARGCMPDVDLILENLKKMVAINPNVGLNVLVTEKNYDHIPEIISFSKSIGISKILYLTYKQVGRGKSDKIGIYGEKLSNLLKYSLEQGIITMVDVCGLPSFVEQTKIAELHPIVSKCNAGNHTVYIDVNGISHPCSFYYDTKQCKLKDNSFI